MHVEFLGIPRQRVGMSEVIIDADTLGDVLRTLGERFPSLGDLIMRWAAPLHVGNFGGLPIKITWSILGLAPPLLFVTGFIMWWTRVVRPRWLASRRENAETAA